ncbi:MAG: hypothetical protein KDA28_14720 [Phycisphaerales bacterium]|nr:hypothetical protein [Phycisphaerales bacterium]
MRFPDADDRRHHAWIDVSSAQGDPYTLVIHGWGLNTEPEGPIRIGQIPAPGGLALLALGAFGIRRAREG